ARTSPTGSGVPSPTRPGSVSPERPRLSQATRPAAWSAAGRGGRALPVLDQRKPAAAVVEGARGPELAIDGGEAAEDVVAAARVRALVHGPVVARAAQDQGFAAVRRRV